MNWKKLPLKEASISLLITKNKAHKGEIKVSVYKSSLGFGWPIGKYKFFKTKAEVLEYISTQAIEEIFGWID